MSSFCGLIEEIPFISVDRFDDKNLESKIFFLSHCHWDHMNGLFSSKLSGSLYTTIGSEVFIKNLKYYKVGLTVQVLDTFCSQEIEYEVNNKKYSLVVTALPARHCPGSVMFLFQTKTCNILYTGDFRIELQDLRKSFNILQENKIDTVYLDSTFLNRFFPEFPRQIESINKIINIIDKWLQKNSKNQILFILQASYGSEYLFIEIYRKLKEKIYYCNNVGIYNYFPNMDNCIERYNESKCRIKIIHKRDIFKYKNSEHYCIIKPSALYWENWKKGNKFVSVQKLNSALEFRVALSYHCSLFEIKDFLNFIKPKQIKLNVLPNTEEKINEMYETLREIYKPKYEDKEINECLTDYKNEKCVKFTNFFQIKSGSSSDSDSEENSLSKRKYLPKRIKY